ncbi:DJ-1/PfpI family protein [Pseudomonas protegens]|uniref:type 1 glutamine amidotransferase family protein n=1 Tax=Pseudomonas TaxID=286 RepID=UPI000F4723A8|nr:MULTISPECIES: type 1 glutamine amidotransferase family protein [Pseudomonas]MCS4258560.1 putative intracellular protease/amidase [Pseudomonas sp. BIGb0176]MDT3420189.1 putative intracellular protease/amidase [Pseudomonas protegens]ROM24803.1 glutamine amidotransferase [Pseudomonas protegens]ROQ57970.1 DJ-1/PfpI family protein [Pseudomonas protegens]ROQ86163.1 DJ-1/PfpI family protein [Pseudomonas protegens]
MTRAITLVCDNFADWETALINATGRGYYGFDCRYASPKGAIVTSMGGLRVTPDLALEDIRLDEVDLLMVCGGTVWQSPQAPDIRELLRAAKESKLVLAGICDGTRELARAGVLDQLKHTSNSADNLLAVGYAGAAHYQDVPHAVADQRVITAPGSAPVSFMAQILGTLGISDDNLTFYLGLHAAEHRQQA